MVEIYLLLSNLDMHLHCDMFKVAIISLPQILDVVVANNQINLTIKPIQDIGPLCGATQTKIAEMKHNIVRADYAIPVGYESFVHNLHILKWPTTEVDNIGVVEVSVGCKEHPISIKFVVHNFIIYRITALLIKVCYCHWTELMERLNITNGYKQKSLKSEELSNDSYLFF